MMRKEVQCAKCFISEAISKASWKLHIDCTLTSMMSQKSSFVKHMSLTRIESTLHSRRVSRPNGTGWPNFFRIKPCKSIFASKEGSQLHARRMHGEFCAKCQQLVEKRAMIKEQENHFGSSLRAINIVVGHTVEHVWVFGKKSLTTKEKGQLA